MVSDLVSTVFDSELPDECVDCSSCEAAPRILWDDSAEELTSWWSVVEVVRSDLWFVVELRDINDK